MFTDTGELSSRELWQRVAIAFVALAIVLLVGRWIFHHQVHSSISEMRTALHQAQVEKKQKATEQGGEKSPDVAVSPADQ